MNKAYKVTVDSVVAIVFATSPAKAKWVGVSAWRYAVCGAMRIWPKVSVRRWRGLDNSPLKDKPTTAWCMDFVVDSLKQK